MRNVKEKTSSAYCKNRVHPLLQANARARMHGDEATTADGLVLVLLLSVGSRTHTRCLRSGIRAMHTYVEGTAAAGNAARDFQPSHRDIASSNKHN